MAFWRKKPRITDHYIGGYGSAQIEVTKRRGEPEMIDVKLSVTAEFPQLLDVKRKYDELGPHHPETLDALHRYAVTLGGLPGQRDEAIEVLEWLVDAYADGQEMSRLLALNDLTRLLQDGGRYTLAEQRLREALSGWERLRGQDDPHTLQIASNLADVLIELGRREEAEGLMRDTVARRTRTLGAAHPDTVKSRNTLATTLRGSPARLAEAERMYRALLVDLVVLDSDGATDLTLGVQNNLAAVLSHQGKHSEALTMYRELIDARSRHYGDDHPDTWTARLNYAVVLNSLGNVTEAETRLAEVLEGYRRLHGRRHPATLQVQVSLAANRANQGRKAEAAPLLRDAIDGYRSTHGPNHPFVRELTGILAQMNE